MDVDIVLEFALIKQLYYLIEKIIQKMKRFHYEYITKIFLTPVR